jgi:hypothetical protein
MYDASIPAPKDLTNAQFSIPNAHPNPPMKIENRELSIGQIPSLIRHQ